MMWLFHGALNAAHFIRGRVNNEKPHHLPVIRVQRRVLAHFTGAVKKESKEDVWDEEYKRTACATHLCMEEEEDD